MITLKKAKESKQKLEDSKDKLLRNNRSDPAIEGIDLAISILDEIIILDKEYQEWCKHDGFEQVPELDETITPMDSLDRLHNTIVFDSRDWSNTTVDAWIYGIVVGWDDASLLDLQEKFNWPVATVCMLKAMHEEYQLLKNRLSNYFD